MPNIEPYAPLMQYPQFILWREIPAAPKPLKVPHSIHTAAKCDAHDPTHWADFETVKATAEGLGPDFGVGFVLTSNDPFFLLDLDNCLEGAAWSQLAQDACAAFPGALVEVSRSGHGLHVIGSYASIPEHKCKNADLGFELYHTHRFVALGNMATARGSAGQDCTPYLPGTVDAWFSPTIAGGWDEWHEGPVEGWYGPEDDDELLKRMLASGSAKARLGGGVTFKQLFEADEDALAQAYPDNFGQGRSYDGSSVDAALFSHLAFWTGKDCPRMERLARRSALAREKWDSREDYLERTVRGACGVSADIYRGKVSERPEPTARFDDPQPTPAAPTAVEFPEVDPETLKVEIIRELHGDHMFDGATIIQATFDGRLKDLDGQLHFFTNREWRPIDDALVRRLIGRSMAPDIKVTSARIAGTFSVIRDNAERIGEPDPPTENVFFRNCVLDNGQARPHAPHYRNTRTLATDYTPGATCPKFLAWLADIFASEPARAALLQELVGWTLCRSTLGIEKAALFLGPPRAGKGVILRLLKALHGRGARPFRLPELDSHKILSSLSLAHMGMDTDAVGPQARQSRSIMGLVKVITANEPISIQYLYEQAPRDRELNCKLFLSANEIPTLWDDSAATANRWVPLVFTESYLDREDPTLYAQFLEELPGIALWAYEGLARLRARGRFDLPASSLNALDAATHDSSPMLEFIEDGLELAAGAFASNAEIWGAYQAWAIRNGHEPARQRAMLRNLATALQGTTADRKVSRIPGGGTARGFSGVRVKPAGVPDNVTPIAPAG